MQVLFLVQDDRGETEHLAAVEMSAVPNNGDEIYIGGKYYAALHRRWEIVHSSIEDTGWRLMDVEVIVIPVHHADD